MAENNRVAQKNFVSPAASRACKDREGWILGPLAYPAQAPLKQCQPAQKIRDGNRVSPFNA
eukprot:scaffold171455_cov38-Prasinocladus_malaysianus.AAC.1